MSTIPMPCFPPISFSFVRISDTFSCSPFKATGTPFSKVKEFKQKYKFYNTDTYLDFDSDYKIIYEGYKNNNFNEFKKQFNNFN